MYQTNSSGDIILYGLQHYIRSSRGTRFLFERGTKETRDDSIEQSSSDGYFKFNIGHPSPVDRSAGSSRRSFHEELVQRNGISWV